jgi:hypothetical protein
VKKRVESVVTTQDPLQEDHRGSRELNQDVKELVGGQTVVWDARWDLIGFTAFDLSKKFHFADLSLLFRIECLPLLENVEASAVDVEETVVVPVAVPVVVHARMRRRNG